MSGRLWLHGGGAVRLGDRVRLEASTAPIELHSAPGAELVIGDDVVIEGGSSIEAHLSVAIGERSRIRAFSKILDNHFHPLRGDRHQRPRSVPVVIGPDAEVGARAIVLPGARVPAGAVVASGAVVYGRSSPRATSSPPSRMGQAERSPQGKAARLLSRGSAAVEGAAALARAGWLLGSGALIRHVHVFGDIDVVNDGALEIGDRVAFMRGMIPTRLVSRPGGRIRIGDNSHFNYGQSIDAHSSVCIGRRCMVASMVRLHDRDGDRTAPITVGDDVWIAHGAVLAPGVTVGDGSVVAAGSVVQGDVPPGTLAMGNPARCVSLALVTR